MIQNPFEIPQQMRDLAEKNIEQARMAYDQFMGAMNQAMAMWVQSIPGNGMTAASRGWRIGRRCSPNRTQRQLSH